MGIIMITTQAKIVSGLALLFIAHSSFSMEKEVGPKKLTSQQYKAGNDLLKTAREGDSQKVRELIREGAPLSMTDIRGMTPLAWAVLFGHDDIANLLLDQGAGILMDQQSFSKQYYGRGALSNTMRSFDEMIQFITDAMKKRVFDIFLGNETIFLLLHKNAEDLLTTYLKTLDAYKGLATIKDKNGNTLLHVAIIKGNFRLAKLLLSYNGKLLSEKNTAGVTPFELGFALYEESGNQRWKKFLEKIPSTLQGAVQASKRAWEASKAEMRQQFEEEVTGIRRIEEAKK